MSTRIYGLALSILTSVAFSCSGDGGGGRSDKPEEPASPYKEYAIHVVAKTKKGELLLEFPPMAALSAPGTSAASKSSAASSGDTAGPGSKAMVSVESDGGAVSVDITQGPAFLLLMRAVAQCRGPSNDFTLHLTPPWMPLDTGLDSWFVFKNKLDETTGAATFDSCEEILASEQALLCAADKLKEIADAVAPITWAAINSGLVTFTEEKGGGAAPSYMHDEWVIPPQNSKDKFVVRDLAISVLANLARLDLEPVIGLPPGESCGNAWVQSSVDDNYFNGLSPSIYGSQPYFDVGTSVSVANKLPLGEGRLTHNAQTLRVAGRLLRELIDDSVMADLAGAERQRARSADSGRGPELYWGRKTDADAPYNSLAHAFRVVFGRWETPRPSGWGPAPTFGLDQAPVPSGDPACGAYAPMALLTDAMGPGTSARWQDRRVRKPAQQAAVQLIDRAGLVIPKQSMDLAWAQGNFGTIVTAVKKQLVLSAAVEVGASGVNDPAFAFRKQAIETMVDGLDHADLRFGLDRSFGAYRLLAGADEGIGAIPAPDPAGVKLVASAEVDPDIAAVSGNVVKAGMQRSDVTGDIMARVGPAQAASQCFDAVTPGVPWGGANLGKVAAFRDAFMVGDTFRRRLSQIAQLTASWGPSRFPKLADAGATELRTWTGPAHGSLTEWGGNLYVRLLGISPEDLGVSTPAEMKNRIVAVWGKPWVADCAAKLRKSCPENFEQNYVRVPLSESVNEEDWEYYSLYGNDQRVLSLEIPLASGPPSFTPTFTPVGSPASDILYLVARSDPKNPGFGKVLASLALRSYPSGAQPAYFLVSDYQRKLANDIFGVSEKWNVNGTKVGEQSLGSSPAYCIPGVPRDFFVPLENELTSDADSFESSWKHYLTLAKQATAQADQLGDKLIEIGLQQDFRREAATEELGKLCGDFTAIDNLEVSAGKVKPTSDDSSLNDCLNEPKYELVFLTTKPPPEVSIKEDILGCPGNSNPLCGQAETEETIRAKSGALNIVDFHDPETQGSTQPPTCEAQLGVVASLTAAEGFAGKKLHDLAVDPEMGPGRMASILKSLRLTVGSDLQWEAKLDGQLVMSTSDTSYWPACGGCNSVTPQVAKDLALQLRDIFGNISTALPTLRDNMLQRVTGAIWLMAAMSGQLPAGVFKLPVPAVNGGTSDANAGTIYGKGLFTQNGNTYHLDASPDSGGNVITDKDVDIINDANGQPIDVNFANAAAASPLRPPWQADVYTDHARHIHLTTSNVARSYPPQPTIATWITGQGERLAGARASSGVVGSCLADVQQKDKALAEHRKIKYPPNAIEKVCTTPDGASSLLVFGQSKSYVKDIFVVAGGKRKESEVIPGYKGKWVGAHEANPDYYDDNSNADANGCKHSFSQTADGFSVGKVKLSCVANADIAGSWLMKTQHTRFTRSALLPSSCTPNERAQLFVNSNNPMTTGCDAARELSQALALTCVLGAGYKTLLSGDPLPAMNDPDDIIKLETWLLDQSVELRKKLSRLYLTKVPKRVVSDAVDGKVGSGTYKGQHGQLVLQYREHLSSLATGWLEVSQELASVSSAIRHARISLQAANLQNQLELKKLAMDEIGLHAAIAKAAVDVVDGIKKTVNPLAGGDAQAVKGAIDAQAFAQQILLLKEIKNITNDKNANAVLGILATLSDETGQHYTNIQKALESMRISVAEALKTASSLNQNENEAKYHAAKGLGADWAYDTDGKIIEYPVNTVLRRQYDITQRRYQAALRDAKYLSYMARLAIEQRIGMRLDDIDEPVGTLEEPSKWADDVCSFQGIDYAKLRKAATPEGNIFQKIESVMWDKYVDPYIGDYTDKLEKFVEFYNIKYPSHEGDDVAVLSIRDDLLGPQGTCFKPSKNLLLFSHDLTRLEAGADDGSEPARGWKRVNCEAGDPKCLSVAPGSILKLNQSALAPPGIAPSEGITWLSNSDPASQPEVDAGAPTVQLSSAPAGSVYQTVELQVGSFALSWFDRAWGATSTDPGPLPAAGPDAGAGPPADYFVGVYDASWTLVGTFSGPPNVPVTGDAGVANPWSDRRVLAFATKAAGPHHVVFSPSAPGASFGSVAIADVQLEQAPSAASATPYEATDASRLVLTGKCAEGNAEVFRQAFAYSCDAKNCFYDLRAPFTVKLGEALAGSALAGKVAQDNYNYRHLDLALNVVGTGVVDCVKKPSPSCFGSPYLEYTLEHVATAAPIIDHVGHPHEFNFGIGGVRFGKALAAERFITLPLSSADQGLLSQPQFTKVELRGRPLEGTYRLRVYDNPALNWSHVEDIQIVLNYRYWSKVDNSSQQK